MSVKQRLKRLYVMTVVILVVAELAVILLSWLLAATMAEGVHALLSSEGIRWFVGSFSSMLATPVLTWLLLVAMAIGCLCQSGFLSYFGYGSEQRAYREKVALRTALSILLAYVLLLLLLTVIPHAVLLSATGCLQSSPFSRALVPLIAFGLFLFSVVYGWTSGHFTSVADVVGALGYGIGKLAPLFILYMLFMQLYMSLCFVFVC